MNSATRQSFTKATTCSVRYSLALVTGLANRALSILGNVAVLVADAWGALYVLLVYEGLYALLYHGDVRCKGSPCLGEHLLNEVIVAEDLEE